MKSLLLASVLLTGLSSSAQYYYKDVLGARESSDQLKSYLKNKVSRVILTSYDADDTKSDYLYVQQQFFPETRVLRTVTGTGTGSDDQNTSVLYTYADANGNLIKTRPSARSRAESWPSATWPANAA